MLVLLIAGSGWCLYKVSMGVLQWAGGLILILPLDMAGSKLYLRIASLDGDGLMLGVRLQIGASGRRLFMLLNR